METCVSDNTKLQMHPLRADEALVGPFGVTWVHRASVRCPWHPEKTGSFALDLGQRTARCFGCGVNADITAIDGDGDGMYAVVRRQVGA